MGTRWISITPKGAVQEHEDEPSLGRLQTEVEGDLEALPSPVPDLPVSVFVNEAHMGSMGKPLLLNPKASTFMQPVTWPGQRIVGTMCLTGSANPDGDLLDLTVDQVKQIRELFQ